MMTRLRTLALLVVSLFALAIPCLAQSIGTLSPAAYQTVLDINGNPVSGAKICFYLAGTTTPATTYSDVTLATPNANPLRADASGRWLAYLSPGASYKFTFQDATGTVGTCDGAVIKSVDNIAAVPTSTPTVDVTGTAGETLSAGVIVYLSDGSGGKSAGLWYLADADFTYASSLAPTVGVTLAAITTSTQGSIRIGGETPVTTSLTPGANYYASATAGAFTATAPTNTRFVGQADGVNSIVLSPPLVASTVDNGINDFRLTLTTGVPVTTADVTAATTLYATPSGRGNRIALTDSAGQATIYLAAQFSIAVPATTSTMYDVYCYANAGVPTLELLAWTNDTTRATALVLTTTGTYTKSGDLTRRYLGSMRTTTVSGQTEDSFLKRYLWNYYNRARRIVKVTEATDSWPYTTATWRQANAAPANQVAVITGVAESPLTISVVGLSANGTGDVANYVSIGMDSTSAPTSGVFGVGGRSTSTAIPMQVRADLTVVPTVGYHTWVWLERSVAAGTTTWYGDNADATLAQSGLFGWIDG